MHILDKTIYYHDTDCGQVVYYANYLKYFEEGRTEYMRGRGVDFKVLNSEGVGFAVRRAEIDYKAPACYADNVKIATRIEKMKNASMEFFQEIKRGDDVLVSGKVILVCVSREFRPVVIPDGLRKKLSP